MEKEILQQIRVIKKIMWTTGILLILLILFFFLSFIIELLLMVFAGVLLAVFLGGLAELVHSKTPVSYKMALFLVILLLLVILVGSQFIEGPYVVDQITQLLDRLPEGIERIQTFLQKNEWIQRLFPRQEVFPLGREIIGGLTGVFSNIFSFLGIVFIVLFIGIYLAVNPHIYINGISALVPADKRPRFQELIKSMGQALRWWLFGRISSMFVVGFLTAIGLTIIGMPLAFALGLIAALLSFIPYLGPVLSAIPAILLALAESPIMVLYVIVLYMFIQTLESYFITPLIQERAVSMPPALLITMQILMGFLGGGLGILLATPLTVVIIVAIQILYVRDILGDKIKMLGEH